VFCHERSDETKEDLCAAALTNMSTLSIKEFARELQKMAYAAQDGGALATGILSQYNSTIVALIDLSILEREEGVMSEQEKVDHFIQSTLDEEDIGTKLLDMINKALKSAKDDDE
jgi:3-phosphoglycerate kinase